MIFSAFLMRFSSTIVSISVQASFNALKRSTWLWWAREGAVNDGIVSNTSKEGTSPFGPIVSLIAFVEARSLLLLSNSGCSGWTTLKIRRSGR